MSQSPSREDLPANERWDRVLELLSAEPRRMVIVSLLEVSGSQRVPLPDAADSPNLSKDPEELSIQLRHHHLPKLAEPGYVRWERDPFAARRGPNFDEARIPIELLVDSLDQVPRSLIHGCDFLEERV